MKATLSVNIPFAGFYDSTWSHEIDNCEEREVEHFIEETQEEEGIALELRLVDSEYFDILYKHSDYSAMHASAARKIGDAWNNLASEALGFPLAMSFEEMTSPREYNFTTDKIFMSIPRDSVAKLVRLARRDKYTKLAAMIKERHTSRSGFISFYSNNLAEWLAKPVSQWDHNELGTLIRAYVLDLNEDYELYYAICDCDGLYEEWFNGVDWAAVEEDVDALREEKREALQAENPDYVAPEPRCPFTLDMFDKHA
jgi:hypothetical protein